MSLLIDADFIVYKCCAACETEVDWGNDVITVTSRFSDAYDMVQRELGKIAKDLRANTDIILFFSDAVNFRKSLDPAYKGHRNRKKPCGYKRVINKLADDYHTVILPLLEADDAIGIYATKEPGHIICSPDKDMKQIPGKLYDLTNKIITINKTQGERWHYVQTMSGDQTDGYSGIPGIGIKRAEALLDEHGANWETVVHAFNEKGLDEDTALLNARLAKILQIENYDLTDQAIRLWNPSSSNGDDLRAEVQAKTA